MPAATTPGTTGAETLPPLHADLAGSLEDLLAWARRLVPPGEQSLAATGLLARLARSGSAGVTALAVAEGVSQPAMSQMLARLERDGLVTRQPHPDDGRALVVALTGAGHRLVVGRRAQRASALSALLEAAPDDDAALLRAAAPALARLAEAATQQLGRTTDQNTSGRTPLP